MSSCSSRVRETTPSRRPPGLSAECSVEDFLSLTEPWNPNSFPEIQLVKKIVRVPTVIIGGEFLDGVWQTTQGRKRFSLQRSSVFPESEACNASSDRGQISRLWLNTLPLLESCAKEFKFIIDDPDSADFGWFRAPHGRFRPACTSRMLPTFPPNSYLSSHGYTRLLAYPLGKLQPSKPLSP